MKRAWVEERVTNNLTDELREIVFSEEFGHRLRALARNWCGRNASQADIEVFETEVLEVFLQNHVERGVFEEPPTVSRTAQVMLFLGYAVQTVRRRNQRRLNAHQDDDDALRVIAADQPSFEWILERSDLLSRALEHLPALASPAQRLAVRWAFRPRTLTETDVRDLNGYKAGGHVVLVREWLLAWEMVRDARERLDEAKVPHRQQPVAEAVSFRVAPSEIDQAALKRAVNSWQAHQSRGLMALRELLESEL